MSYAGYGPPPTSIYAPSVTTGYTSPVGMPSVTSAGYPVASGPPMLAMPPDADPQLWKWFHGVNADRSGEITVVELQRALDNGDWTPFDLDTIKLLMQLFDTDRTGFIGFKQVRVFRGFGGISRTGKMRFDILIGTIRDDRWGELRDALAHFGYRLAPRLIELIARKYASPLSYGPNAPPGITFDRFVRACVVVKQITESFKRHDTNSDGWIQIDYDGFLEIVLSLP
ncbi:hypothetical protein JVU11DRAFT_7551 [Chiua virens]|nr:hypothetical protein JVU11DRAFT_7551 [Chiua virens]